MRRIALLAVVVGLGLAACSSSASKPAAAPVSQPPSTTASAQAVAPTQASSTAEAASTSSTCNLPDRGDIIEWQKAPGVADSAIELGGTDPAHCVLTFDSLKTSSPTGAGYCTQAAWASDNVGYDPDATPAPRLKKIQVSIGDCG